MTTIRWTRAAADDLVQIGRYLKDHQPALAQSTVHTLYEAAESLTQFPHRGRVGQDANTRELVVAPLPYVIVCRVAGDVVFIARIVHGAQDWQPEWGHVPSPGAHERSTEPRFADWGQATC